MMLKAGVLVAALALAAAGCGSDDVPTEEAQAAVNGQIQAFIDGDYERVCELGDARGRESIAQTADTETCAEGYEELFRRQQDFSENEGKPFDDFVEMLEEYEAGEVTEVEFDDSPISYEVKLVGPEEASAFLVEEDGEVKVSELFVTPDAGAVVGGGGTPAP